MRERMWMEGAAIAYAACCSALDDNIEVIRGGVFRST